MSVQLWSQCDYGGLGGFNDDGGVCFNNDGGASGGGDGGFSDGGGGGFIDGGDGGGDVSGGWWGWWCFS